MAMRLYFTRNNSAIALHCHFKEIEPVGGKQLQIDEGTLIMYLSAHLFPSDWRNRVASRIFLGTPVRVYNPEDKTSSSIPVLIPSNKKREE